MSERIPIPPAAWKLERARLCVSHVAATRQAPAANKAANSSPLANKPKTDRRVYMRDLMRRIRAERRIAKAAEAAKAEIAR